MAQAPRAIGRRLMTSILSTRTGRMFRILDKLRSSDEASRPLASRVGSQVEATLPARLPTTVAGPLQHARGDTANTLLIGDDEDRFQRRLQVPIFPKRAAVSLETMQSPYVRDPNPS